MKNYENFVFGKDCDREICNNNCPMWDDCSSNDIQFSECGLSQIGDEWKNQVVSENTHKESDLKKIFADVIRQEYGPKTASVFSRMSLEDMWDIMEYIAPNGTYFGAHKGDGALFGFWECDD